MTTGIVSWDFDVPREWFKIPLDEDLDSRRWAGSFAQEIAEFLEVDGPIKSLADALYDVQSQLSQRRDPWLTALVAVRAEAPISMGAVIMARQLARDADGTPESVEAQMRRDAKQMEPGSRSRDLVLWRDRADAGDYVGMTQRIEHAGRGMLSERAIYVVFPPGSSDAVYFEFTTTDLDYFADIRHDTEFLVRTLRVTLGGADGGTSGGTNVTLGGADGGTSGGTRRTRSPSRADNRVGVKLPPAFVSVVLIVIGIVLALLGVASIAQLYLLGMRGAELEGIYPFFEDGELDSALPGVLLLLAMAPLFLGELLRRASWSVGYGGFWGGSVRTVVRPLPAWALVLWLLAPLAAWTALVLIPVLAREGEYASASEGFWLLAGMYGFVAAAVVGILLMSLLKRAVFARAEARGLVAPERGRAFWKFLSGQVRIESGCAGLAAGFAGILPVIAADPVALRVIGVIAAVLAVVGVLFALGSWRTGESIGYAESVT
ncbi:hypothetical protein BH09ACT3_BH09ACT3_14110 [soil metagenome]